MTSEYDDIIDLPHHVSSVRKPMPRANRAAQFMPFAALAGYEAALHETARLTDRKIELHDDLLSILDDKLRFLQVYASEKPEAEFLVFQPDGKKNGGSYVSIRGIMRRVDEEGREVILTNGRRLPLKDILDVSCELFTMLEDQGS